jgi:hypothetical protein
VLGPLLQLAALRFRSEKFKELEIVVLRHELAVLGRQAGQPVLQPDEACSRSKLSAGSTQTELSAPQAGFAKYIIPNTVIASALALRAASTSSSAGAAS